MLVLNKDVCSIGAMTFGIMTLRIMRSVTFKKLRLMEQHNLKSVNSCWNTNITFCLETFGSQNSNLYLRFIYMWVWFCINPAGLLNKQ